MTIDRHTAVPAQVREEVFSGELFLTVLGSPIRNRAKNRLELDVERICMGNQREMESTHFFGEFSWLRRNSISSLFGRPWSK